jgi:hypothetical protein
MPLIHQPEFFPALVVVGDEKRVPPRRSIVGAEFEVLESALSSDNVLLSLALLYILSLNLFDYARCGNFQQLFSPRLMTIALLGATAQLTLQYHAR